MSNNKLTNKNLINKIKKKIFIHQTKPLIPNFLLSLIACSLSNFICLSLSKANFLSLFITLPVPAGINLPTITFSFNHPNYLVSQKRAASVKTLVVS